MHHDRRLEPARIQNIPVARFGYRRNRAGFQISTQNDGFWSIDHWAAKWFRDGCSWRNGDEHKYSWRSFRPDEVVRAWWSGVEAYFSGNEKTDEMGSPCVQRQAPVNVWLHTGSGHSWGERSGHALIELRRHSVSELIKSFWIIQIHYPVIFLYLPACSESGESSSVTRIVRAKFNGGGHDSRCCPFSRCHCQNWRPTFPHRI